jgi:cysteine desulfurase
MSLPASVARRSLRRAPALVGAPAGTTALRLRPQRSFCTSGAPSTPAPEWSIAGSSRPGKAIYLDSQATTPLDPRALDAMLPYMTGMYGNPHSVTHAYGWESAEVVDTAREQVAGLINANPKEIVFTSGATESNNMAVKGVANFYSPRKNHVITTVTEHKCVLDSCRALQQQGFDVTFLPVGTDGLVKVEDVAAAIRKETALVSVMQVNNEIGVIQPIAEIGKLCRERKVFFHVDAAQAVGKIPVDVDELNVDLMSISAHKLYGPKGIGALYVRRRPRVRLDPVFSGGGQERGFRSGTLPHPLIAGFGAACEIAGLEMERDLAHVQRLSKKLHDGIVAHIPHVEVNGSIDHRYPGNLNISFAYVEGESLLMALKDIAISSGSACTSASLEPSYVLRALGVEDDMAHTSIRFGIGRFTTDAEVDYALQVCLKHVDRLREMSPLWEMVQEGIDLKSIQWSSH